MNEEFAAERDQEREGIRRIGDHAEDTSEGNVWTVPLGLGLGKVVKLGGKLPVKFQVAAQYMVVRPAHTGQEWNLQFVITPVIPKLIKGTLFE